jgi:hypothetical protein
MRLVGGRGADPGRVTVAGDQALGRAVAENLAFL